jgi:hypothetical protein
VIRWEVMFSCLTPKSLRLFAFGALGLVALLGGGCSGNGAGPARACIPGASVSCACAGSRVGAQICNASGSGYNVCSCTGPAGTGGSTGGRGGAGNSAGGGAGGVSGGTTGGAGGALGGTAGGGAAGQGGVAGSGQGGVSASGGTSGSSGASGAVGGMAGTSPACGAVSVSPVILFGSLNPGESQQLPAIAFDGTNYLAVWQQGLSPGTNWKLYGSRVSQDGVVLDTPPFLISNTFSVSPAVAFNGTDFDVVWDDDRASSYQIYGARVTTSGTVRDPAGIPIETNPSESPSIACGAGGCLVVWRYINSATAKVPVGIYGTRLDGSLTTLDSPRIPLPLPADCTPDGGSSCQDAPADPNVVSAGSDYFITWATGKGIEGTTVSVAGGVSGAPISIGGPSPFRTGLTFGGTELFVTWVFGFGSSPSGFDGSRVAGTNVLDSPPLPIATTKVDDSPATAFDGLHFMTVWTGGTGQLLTGARVTIGGALLDGPGFSVDPGAASYGQAPAIASSGQRSSLAAYASCTTTSAAPDCRVRAYILQNCP